MKREAFPAHDHFSVCLHESQTVGLQHFMAKSVSHHCVPRRCQTLTELAGCFHAPSEWMLAETRRRWFQSAATGRGRVRFVSEEKVKAGCALSIPLPCLEWFCFQVWWFWRAYLCFERGGSRLGLDSSASWSVELKSCMTWAASSLCQKTGEMLLRGQYSIWFMATKQTTCVK